MPDAHRFAIRAADLPDALIRLLGPFAVRQARLVTVDQVLTPDAAVVNLVVSGLSEGEAAHLQARLLAMPCVHVVEVEALVARRPRVAREAV